jgi:hypothetical protein
VVDVIYFILLYFVDAGNNLLRKTYHQIICILFCAAIFITLGGDETHADEQQQINVSATPALITLPSPLPLSPQETSAPTTTHTPTPIGPLLLEALTEANVRSKPDPESDLLGTIRAGDIYPVLGRYYRWYQFQYDNSSSGTGWVFDELVNVTGDESQIVDLSENALPTVDNTAISATNTMEAVTQTPGGILTVTAASQVIPLPVPTSGDQSAETSDLGDISVLPTFTFPPEITPGPPDSAFRVDTLENMTPTQVASTDLVISVSDGIPPILPILILGGLGLLGLIGSSIRR